MMNPETSEVYDHVYKIWKAIKCEPDEKRKLQIREEDFAEVRKKIESFIKKSYMRAVQAPLGVKPRLVTWMQIS